MLTLRKLLVYSFFFFAFIFSSSVCSNAENVRFNFGSFSIRNLTLLGDSYLRKGVIGLTRELKVPSTSAGAVIYNRPVSFFDEEMNTTASFSTRFSFSIANVNPTSSGDGFCFFISPNNRTLGCPGGFLGLVNSSKSTKNKFVAIEFDTFLDSTFNDPSDNHIGLDVESFDSIKTADPVSQGIDLKSGSAITAWIEYRHDREILNVFLSYSSSKPQIPLLTADIDLSNYLKHDMYIGFSGSTKGSTELHKILDWGFQTSGFVPTRPKSKPHNVSDSSVIASPDITAAESESESNTTKYHYRLVLGLGIAGPAFLCIVLVISGYISMRKLKKIRTRESFKAELSTGPREFRYRELKEATKGFHSSSIIGTGAFGTVYKAFFVSSGATAAVKRSKHSHQGKTEFLVELSIIARLRHKNLVQLQGWCVEKGELLLVYDFMPNGSLDRLLYQEDEDICLLKWSHRYNIAVGLASVLTYLHQECEQQVIHRDIKTGNVLLDGNFKARLGDFGLAKLTDHDKSPISTLTAGTMGYLAPEYLQYGKATEKTDVFSYGVVILEVACGRRPIERAMGSDKMVNLVDWVWGLHSEGRIIEAADRRLGGEFKEDEMRKLLLVGLSCSNPDCVERPSMRRVLQILHDETEQVSVPKMKPSLSFSLGLPMILDDIVSDEEECQIEIHSS